MFFTALMEFDEPAVLRIAQDPDNAPDENVEVTYKDVEPADTIHWSSLTNHFNCFD